VLADSREVLDEHPEFADMPASGWPASELVGAGEEALEEFDRALELLPLFHDI
jgi:hypothetical protein